MKERDLLDAILKYLALVSVITSATAIYIALLINKRRLGAQIFLTYTDRIFNVRHGLPAESYLNRLGQPKRELTAEERRAVHETLYLIFEFHALRRQGYVARNIWQIVEPDVERLLRSAIVVAEWTSIQEEFEMHPEFVSWVSQKQQKRATVHRMAARQRPAN
jgi:hypothetical protein